jgi:glycosyltransferase involved in cell wall biosynthesis
MGIERNEISVNAYGGTEIMRDLLEKNLDTELLSNFQIIMSRPRELQDDKIRIFQAHDLAQDPESNKFRDASFREMFHKFVFISNWQYSQYQLIHGIPYDTKSIVLESGIIPAFGALNVEDIHRQKDKDIIRIVYTSTPQRGLSILIPVFEAIAEKYDNIHLDVFSSFKIYGWDDADKQYEPLYNRIRNHPKMTYHGFVSNDMLKEHLNKSHIFAYPCIWTETSCRAMLEAMSAGLVCVHPNYGALYETSGGLNIMYQGDFNNVNNHANIFASHLNAAINFVKNNEHLNMIRFNKTYVDSRYSMIRIKNQWESMLNDLLKQYPTKESRTKKEVFVYKT